MTWQLGLGNYLVRVRKKYCYITSPLDVNTCVVKVLCLFDQSASIKQQNTLFAPVPQEQHITIYWSDADAVSFKTVIASICCCCYCCKCLNVTVFKLLCSSTVLKVHGAGCLQWVCEQLQHCNGSRKEDVRLQTWLPGIPQGLRKTF